MRVDRHLYSLAVSGYTVLRAQIAQDHLTALRRESEASIDAVARHLQAGQTLSHTYSTAKYLAARCLYCWGDGMRQVLELDCVHAIGAAFLERPRLWDLTVHTALPAADGEQRVTTTWHRDFTPKTDRRDYLWSFVCIDDLTADNGAPWCVPGSQRPHDTIAAPSWEGDDPDVFPSRIQITASAGDVVMIDPTMLHTSGRNTTSQPRRLLNFGLCSAAANPLVDHQAIGGSEMQRTASSRVRALLDPRGVEGLDQSWEVLPPGWITRSTQRKSA